MKKLLIACCMLLGFSGMVSAQVVAKKAAKQTTSQAKPATTKVIPATQVAAGPVKKDGTLDKRYNANKNTTAAPVAGPVKKDGTPDKRYKANKKN